MDEPLPIDTGTSAIGQVPLAEEDPVAHVLIDHPVPHLARAFDYAVPEKLAETARPGVRVRVRFAGRLRDGFLLERVEKSEHIGPLATIERITSPVVVLTPELLRAEIATGLEAERQDEAHAYVEAQKAAGTWPVHEKELRKQAQEAQRPAAAGQRAS